MSVFGRTGLSTALIVALLLSSPAVVATSHQTPGEEATNNLFLIVLLPALGIGILVNVLILYAVVKFRKRKGHTTPPANPKVHDAKLEAAWTIAPAVILLFVGLATFQSLQITDTIPEDPDVVVRVVGHQWFWEFFVDDLNGNVTRTIGELTVKQGQVVKLVIESVDVAHSIWILQFGLKVDAIPGRVNVYWFQALEPGEFDIRCAEFCGTGHTLMTATLHVVP